MTRQLLHHSFAVRALAFIAVSIGTCAFGAQVLDAPIEIENSSSVILGSAAMVENAGEIHCFTPTVSGTHYMQFEINEAGSDNTLDLLGLQFFTDISGDGMFAGEGSNEDMDFVPIGGNADPDFGPQTLANTKAQSVHEWTLTGLIANSTYCVLVTHLEEGAMANGPERIQFSSTSATAVPEPSAFAFLGLITVVIGGVRWTRRRSA